MCVTVAGLDRLVIGEVVRALAARPTAQPVNTEAVADLQAALDHDQAQLVSLTRRRFVETGDLALGEQEYRVAKRLLDARMATARQELEQLSPPGQDGLPIWSARLGEALAKGNGPAYQRELVQVLIERIEVRRAPGTGTRCRLPRLRPGQGHHRLEGALPAGRGKGTDVAADGRIPSCPKWCSAVFFVSASQNAF